MGGEGAGCTSWIPSHCETVTIASTIAPLRAGPHLEKLGGLYPILEGEGSVLNTAHSIPTPPWHCNSAILWCVPETLCHILVLYPLL